MQIIINVSAAGYTFFELNCGYWLLVSYEKDLNPRSRSKAADKLAENVKNLMTACKENLKHGLDIANLFLPIFGITCID